jgi:Mrp family chromosome partitioning ATPase
MAIADVAMEMMETRAEATGPVTAIRGTAARVVRDGELMALVRSAPPSLPRQGAQAVWARLGGLRRKRARPEVAGTLSVREQCRKLCLALFFREQAPVRSLGVTSAVEGEGKTFLALMVAGSLANDSVEPVTYIECNWEHPSIHEYFDLPPTPGLAEWLRGECAESAIRHQVAPNLTVIPAGDGSRDGIKLLRMLQENGAQRSLLGASAGATGFTVVELPPVATCAYAPLAAGLVEAVVLVVRAGVTPAHLVAETCAQIQRAPIVGIVLNQAKSHIPRWLQGIL